MNFERSVWHQKIQWWSLLVAIVLLPYSRTFCHAALILFLLNWLVEGNWENKLALMRSRWLAFVMIVGFFALHVVGLLYTSDMGNGFQNLEKKIFLLLLPVALLSIPVDQQMVTHWLRAFIGTCALAVVICFSVAFYRALFDSSIPMNFDAYASQEYLNANPLQRAWHFFSYQELTSVISIHPTYVGIYCFTCLLLVFFFHVEDPTWRKSWSIILIPLFTLFILFLSSRIILILLLSFIVFGVVLLLWKREMKTAALFSGLFTICLPLVALQPVARFRSVNEIANTNLDVKQNTQYRRSTEIHLSLWWTAWRSLHRGNIVWGVGTGDVDMTMKETSNRFNVTNILATYDPHSQFFSTLLSLGLVGSFFLLGILLIPVFNKPICENLLACCLLGSIFTVCLTESFLESQKGIVFTAIFYPMIVYLHRHVKEPKTIPGHA